MAALNFKYRVWYVLLTGLTVALGLGSRIWSAALPDFVSAHFGDALWAAMVYFGFRILFLNRGLAFAAFAALLFSFTIEFSQLYQAQWINEIRQTLPGSLILGRGFLAIDLVRYSAGIICAFLADRYLFSKLLPPVRKGNPYR